MTLEEQIFGGRLLSFAALLAFGFVQKGSTYSYEEDMMDGQFRAIITVQSNTQVSGCVMDTSLNEPYQLFRSGQATGTFVGQVRQAYQTILENIARAVCDDIPLVSAQARRLHRYIQETYGDQGTTPFAKFPKIYAFRNPFNDKWYALLLSLNRSKLLSKTDSATERQLEEVVEVVNLKIIPERLPELLATAGIYPSYHMNKKHWVTVVLDHQVPDTVLFDLIATSRYLTLPRSEQKKQR